MRNVLHNYKYLNYTEISSRSSVVETQIPEETESLACAKPSVIVGSLTLAQNACIYLIKRQS